jgi:hypothetical protein
MSIEQMKQWLEALEINLIFLRNVKPFKGQEDLASDCVAMTKETITSLRQAIAEAEKQKPVGYGWKDPYGDWYYSDTKELDYVIPLYTQPQPAQPKAEKQEPVAMIKEVKTHDGYLTKAVCWNVRWHELPVGTELHTHPQPKREWVGLTDEDKKSFWTADQMTQEEWDEFYQAVEAKLKEKNT